MRHKTKDKGDLGVAKTIPHLLDHGICCCLPLSEHLPFDLIAVMPDFVTLRRVQVKYRAAKKGFIEVPFRSNYYDSKHIYSKRVNFDEIDCYAIYCPDTNATYYLPMVEIPASALKANLRLQPTRNGQLKGIRLANDYAHPNRIAVCEDIALASRREVTEQDEQAVTRVIADLVERGVQPCIAHSQYLPFDLIAVEPDMKTLKRMRVGYKSVEVNPFIDVYAIYDPAANSCHFLDAGAIQTGIEQVTLGMISGILSL
jgi:hypothetical protein